MVLVKDVANVVQRPLKEGVLGRSNGQQALFLDIKIKSSADIIRTTDEVKVIVNEFFERNLPSVFTTADRERIQLIKQADEVLTLNKGNLTEEQAFWLKDLLLSPNVLVQKNNGAWVSYALQEGSNTILNRDDDQNQIEITLLRSSIDYSQRN